MPSVGDLQRNVFARAAIGAVMLASIAGCSGTGSVPGSQLASVGPTPGPTSVPATAIQLDRPGELSLEGSTMWAIAGYGIARIDVATNAVTSVALSSDALDDLAATPTAIWVADFSASEVLKIDPVTGKIIDTISTGAAEGILAAHGAIWVTNHHEGSVTRIDPTTDKPIGTVVVGKIGSDGPQKLAEGAGSIWVAESNTGEVIRLNPATGAVVAHISVGQYFSDCGGVVATDSAIWVEGCQDTSAVLRIDPATNTVVARIELMGYGGEPLILDGAVWVPVGGLGYRHELERIDPATNTVDRELPLGALTDIGGSAVAGGDFWICNKTDAVLRVPLSELPAQ